MSILNLSFFQNLKIPDNKMLDIRNNITMKVINNLKMTQYSYLTLYHRQKFIANEEF